MAWTSTKIVEIATDQRNPRERIQDKAAISLSLYLITCFSPVIKGGFVPFLTTHAECQEPAHLVCRWYQTTMASNSDKRCHGTLITSAQNILFPFSHTQFEQASYPCFSCERNLFLWPNGSVLSSSKCFWARDGRLKPPQCSFAEIYEDINTPSKTQHQKLSSLKDQGPRLILVHQRLLLTS